MWMKMRLWKTDRGAVMGEQSTANISAHQDAHEFAISFIYLFICILYT